MSKIEMRCNVQDVFSGRPIHTARVKPDFSHIPSPYGLNYTSMMEQFAGRIIRVIEIHSVCKPNDTMYIQLEEAHNSFCPSWTWDKEWLENITQVTNTDEEEEG